jgi:hypothetical protein
MLDVGGQDSTEAFEDVGHSDEAREILDGLLVGTLKRQVNISLPCTYTYTLTISKFSKHACNIHANHRPTLRRAIIRSLPTQHLTRNAPLHPCQTPPYPAPPYPAPRTPGPRNHSAPVPTPTTHIHPFIPKHSPPHYPHNPFSKTERKQATKQEGDPKPKSYAQSGATASTTDGASTGVGLYAIILIGGALAFGAYKYLQAQSEQQ